MRLALALLALLAGTASADPPKKRKPLPPYVPGPPDPAAVDRASEANLVSNRSRQGFVFGVAIGPGLQIGVGVDERKTGTGGGFAIRVGQVATPSTNLILQAATTVLPYKAMVVVDGMNDTKTRLNQSTVLCLGAQHYFNSALWLLAGAGLANYTSRIEGDTRTETDNTAGVGGILSFGVDIVRRKNVTLAVELEGNGAIYSDGFIIGGFLGLGLGVY
jgi:hypothetical protein